jgi:signal transduction histidine kinase
MRRNIGHLGRLVEEVVKENVHVESAGGIYVDRRLLALRPIVDVVIESMHTIAEKNRTVVINEVSECFNVYADGNLLWRVFQNLIGNAIRFAPNGVIRIAATLDDECSKAICEVIGDGVGIPAARLESVFNTLENDAEGNPHGLGLSFTRRLIQAHGGTIKVESEPNRRTVFRFTLPFALLQPASTTP